MQGGIGARRKVSLSHRARPGKGNLLAKQAQLAAALTKAVRDAALEVLGRGMLFLGGWPRNRASLGLSEWCERGEI
jgi:hypothetical protein